MHKKSPWYARIIWVLISLAGTLALSVIAFERGEPISAVWLVVAAVCVYTVAYRFYSRFIIGTVLGADATRATPACVYNDGKDYVPTNRWVVFGHHFAAIAGAGPLVGPILAAQMGYLPGTLWIIIGVVLAGAVQDMFVMFASVRRGGKTLGEMVKMEMGETIGMVAKIGIIAIMIILIAVLALVVVKSLTNSPWGTFTVAMTIPIAVLMGVYMRYLRPGRTFEVSLIGIVLLMLTIFAGQHIAAHPFWSSIFTLQGTTIAIYMIAYGFLASVLPVWLLLAPRDYLSTFLKIGVVVGLALSILLVRPYLAMPAITDFADGTGPVFSGSLFPFLFITIACGAVSGFHSLVASGTTSKMLRSEKHIRFTGYGAMLTESFVAIMAMIAASVIEPGAYFAMNSPTAVIGLELNEVSAAIARMGFHISPQEITQLADDVGEKTIISRTGGAPTLAVGMAHIFQQLIGGREAMAFWYHFAILFEALFILTTIDAGTRVLRFMFQEMLGYVRPAWAMTRSWTGNIMGTSLAVLGWGYFIYQGVIDPLGGVNTLWPLFGLSNQILAVIALTLCTTILIKAGRQKYVWVTLVPMIAMLVITFLVALQKMFHPAVRIGFWSHAQTFSHAYAEARLLAPAKNMQEMQRIITNDYVNFTLCALFLIITLFVLVGALRIWKRVYGHQPVSPLAESPYIALRSLSKKPNTAKTRI